MTASQRSSVAVATDPICSGHHDKMPQTRGLVHNKHSFLPTGYWRVQDHGADTFDVWWEPTVSKAVCLLCAYVVEGAGELFGVLL